MKTIANKHAKPVNKTKPVKKPFERATECADAFYNMGASFRTGVPIYIREDHQREIELGRGNKLEMLRRRIDELEHAAKEKPTSTTASVYIIQQVGNYGGGREITFGIEPDVPKQEIIDAIHALLLRHL